MSALGNTVRSFWTAEAPGASPDSLRAIREDKAVFLAGFVAVLLAVGVAAAGVIGAIVGASGV